MIPIFKSVLQAGFIVSDIFKPIKYFYDNFAMGPWSIYEFNPEVIEDMIVEGREQEYKALIGIIKLKGFGLEYIAPLDGLSTYYNFLKKHGGGFQHLAYQVDDYEEAFKFFSFQKGLSVHQSGSWFGKHISTYFNITSLKHIIEIYRPDSSFSRYKTNKYGITQRTFPVPDKIYPPNIRAGKPLLKRVLSVGLVVKDLRKTMSIYSAEFGISDWQDFKVLENGTGYPEILAARCRVGDIFIELIEPHEEDEKSIYGQFLKSSGEGLHSVGYIPYDFKQVLKVIAKLSIGSNSIYKLMGNLNRYEYICFDFSKQLKHAVKIYNNNFLDNDQGEKNG